MSTTEKCRICRGSEGKHDGAAHDAYVADRPTPPPSAAVPDPADVEKAARAMWTDGLAPSPWGRKPWEDVREDTRETYRRLAVAALTAVRPSPDSEAVARVEALADELEDVARAYCHAPPGTYDAGARNAHMAIARRIRAALGTGDREGGR